MDTVKRGSCHEAGHMAVALHLNRKVESAGICEGRPKVDSFLEPAGITASRECFIFLAAGIAGEKNANPIVRLTAEAHNGIRK